MNYPHFFESQNSLNLFELKENFKFLSTLYSRNKFPKVLMLTGNKGSGKSTLINHVLYSIFDPKNYNFEKNELAENSKLFKLLKKNVFSNIIYLKGSNFISIKVEDIRNLKSTIYKSSILDKERFIILDDIELFNQNSLNALLKLIEEPSKNNYFILINNKTRPLLETIKSRSLEVKLILSENQRLKIIENLINFFDQELVLDYKTSAISPGNFLKFNYVCKEYNIFPTNDFIENLSNLLNHYKKDKDIIFIDYAFFLADVYFRKLRNENILKHDEIYEIKDFIFYNLNNFLVYNLNQNTFLNAVSNKLKHE
tara:strand:- start:508 stop:1443 length:936 start_codon:yes stop_codon:yes gene_type:complete